MQYVNAAFVMLNSICCLMCIVAFFENYRRRKDYEFISLALLNGASAYLNYVVWIHGAL